MLSMRRSVDAQGLPPEGEAVKVAAALLALALTGCSTLADKRMVAGCQVADGVSTKVALDRGATEQNPLFGDMGGNQILAFKVAAAALLYWLMPPVEKMSPTEKGIYATVSVIGCGAAIHNAGQAAKAKP